MDDLVSVIVPVYNTKPYLEACVSSLAAQTHRNLQIILVDDGSTDGSGAICDDFARRDQRITVIHQRNAGVSAARNAGLDAVSGSYVFFLDSDDLLPETSLETLFTLASPKTLVSGSMQEFNGDGLLSGRGLALPNRSISAKEMLWLLFHQEELGYQGYLCNKLFDNHVIQENKLRFDPQIRYNEDRLFLTQYLMHCTSAELCQELIYLYRIHGSSALGTIADSFKSTALTELDAFEQMYILLRENAPELAHRAAWLCFDKTLYWLGRIPAQNRADRAHARRILRTNAFRYLRHPENNLLSKLKVAAHCLLER